MNAPSRLRLYELSIFHQVPSGSAMGALIQGYLDDSRRGHYWAVGGYVGGWHRWEVFEAEWPKVLAKHDVPYFHRREMADANGVYGKWYPSQEHRAELAAFFGDLAGVISQSRLVAVCSLVRIPDLERFNLERGLDIEPYPLAAYGCMLLAARDNLPKTPIELVFDHVEKVTDKLATARLYADSDKYNERECDSVVAVPLPKNLTFREIPALRGADFFAWEFRKHQENDDEWFDLLDKPSEWAARWNHFEQWSVQKFGTKTPPVRKSAAALTEGNEFFPLIWDYATLCEAHELRGGVRT